MSLKVSPQRSPVGGDTLADDPLFDEKETAAYLKIAARTLAVWRCTGRYALRFTKIGRSVRYRKSDLDRFIASRTVTTGTPAGEE